MKSRSMITGSTDSTNPFKLSHIKNTNNDVKSPFKLNEIIQEQEEHKDNHLHLITEKEEKFDKRKLKMNSLSINLFEIKENPMEKDREHVRKLSLHNPVVSSNDYHLVINQERNSIGLGGEEHSAKLFNNKLTTEKTINSTNSARCVKNDRKHKKEKTIKEIQNLSGLVKRKFHFTNDQDEFNIWDCPSIKETVIADMANNFEMRKKLVNFCKKSFLKIYPTIKRYDSSNMDPVKCWICGPQIAAMNVQSLHEDQMLINKILFRINQSCGYIPKPEFLLKEDYDRTYEKPVLRITIEFLSGLMLQELITKEKALEGFVLNCYIIGSWQDDKQNTKFLSKKYKQNLLNATFQSEEVTFNIYEPDLSFIIIKLQSASGNDTLGRSCIPLMILKEGIRVVPLFDNLCQEFDNSQLIIRIKKLQLL
jgi:hypothetical protein